MSRRVSAIVMDDDWAEARLLQAMLLKFGIASELAHGLMEAVVLRKITGVSLVFARQRPDWLPAGEVVQRLREASQLPLQFLVALCDSDACRESAQRDGYDEAIQPPFSAGQIGKLIVAWKARRSVPGVPEGGELP